MTHVYKRHLIILTQNHKKMTHYNSVIAFVLTIVLSGSVFSQSIEKVYLTNNSVLEGYLAEQRPGVSFTVHSIRAEVFAREDTLLDVSQQRTELSALPEQWAEWAATNNVINSDGDGTYLMLSTLTFKNSTVSNVFVKERGVTVKYIDLNERDYTFPWKMLSMTSKNLRRANQKSGIVDELVMTNGQHYVGQVTDQTPGKGIKIIFDNGQVQSFNYSDISQIISKPLNDKMTIWQQSQLMDELQLKSTGEVLRGIITSRRIGKEYTLLSHDGTTRDVPAHDVAVLRKMRNKDYSSAPQRELALGEVLINGDKKWAYFFNDLETTESYIILDKKQASMSVHVGDTIVLEANLGNPMTAIKVAKAQQRGVEVINQKGKKTMTNKWVVTLYDLLQAKQTGIREVNSLGYIKYTFPITESGRYVINIEGKEGYIIIYAK